ncbi:unnamed protein product [Cladocopium goreaui]|uniref:Uncharacterized protein n=1 Tax=Cladocopium goreaui TaxID=2562237 RepID=A0A9P1FNC9_9DINO|nr:unnamed protein product [Cladocopium goreaui]|mmetsp:Transcript_25232/g.55023  ORF Transcript_25232/g.55023 Transcript_25232/m.55023 type:complete len:129 (-) Transcript_25232:345-731(-)
MDFPCKLKNCTQAVVNQYHHVDDWGVSQKSVDQERQMTDDLLSVLAILKSMWSLASIGCTRKCSYAVAWLVFMEVIQALCFAMKLVDWPKFFLHHPRNGRGWMWTVMQASSLRRSCPASHWSSVSMKP